MNAAEYERLTATIAESVRARAEASIPLQITTGVRSKQLGASGFRHQIDVVIEGDTDVIMVECKYWRTREIKVEHLLTFVGRILDITPVCTKRLHSVMVTSSRFQAGCVKLARHFGVDLQRIVSPGEFAFVYKGLRFVGKTPKKGVLTFKGGVAKHEKQEAGR